MITVGNTAPTATIARRPPAPPGGSATSSTSPARRPTPGRPAPASALTWQLILHHCPSNCHTHEIQSFSGVAGGSFTAPDHEYPSYLELRLTATDSGGLSDTKILRLDPRTVVLSFQTIPGGLQLTVGSTTNFATFSRTVIVGSSNTVSAISPQTKGKKTYSFNSSSDGGAQTHVITAPAAATTYTARFR